MGAPGRWMPLAVASAAQLMMVLDVSVVNVAMPALQHDLDVSGAAVQWVASAYTLTFAGALLAGARLADVYGVRAVMLAGLVIFAAASVAGGVATAGPMVIAARAVQGLGAAVVSPATFTVLTRSYPEGALRTRAVAVWTGVSLVGGGLGSVVSGVLTDWLTWRSVLLINVPIGLIVGWLAWRHLNAADRLGTGRVDVIGAGLATFGLSAATLAVSGINDDRWDVFTAGLGVAAASAAGLAVQQRRSPQPLLPGPLLRNRTVLSANALTLLTSACFQIPIWLFLTYLMQQTLGYTALQAGLGFVPLTVITMLVGVSVTPRLLTRTTPPILIAAGALIAAAGLCWQAVAPHTSYSAAILAPAILIGIGGGLLNTPLGTAVTTGVAAEHAGAASGLMNTSKQFGGALGLAALAPLTLDYTTYRTAFVAMAAVMLTVAAATPLLHRRTRNQFASSGSEHTS
ncbi:MULTISPECIES: MFS transporter [Mycolicibacterium]|nr:MULTISPECIES: MFS transporter [Mycolicibacterium]